MQGGKTWINANRSSETLIDWKSGPSMGPNGGSVAMDSKGYPLSVTPRNCLYFSLDEKT